MQDQNGRDEDDAGVARLEETAQERGDSPNGMAFQHPREASQNELILGGLPHQIDSTRRRNIERGSFNSENFAISAENIRQIHHAAASQSEEQLTALSQPSVAELRLIIESIPTYKFIDAMDRQEQVEEESRRVM